MNEYLKRNIVLFFLVTFVVMAIYFYNTSSSYEAEEASFKEFRNKSSELVELQKKWKNQKANQKNLNQIIRQIRPTKQTKSKGIYNLTYENLSNLRLKRLGKLLLNSQLTIKELKLEKSANKVLLHVEVIL